MSWSGPIPAIPNVFGKSPTPPVFLYAVGDLDLLDNPGVAMVGSRECSRYGIELAHRIARELSERGLTIISGLAYGIDREAHLGGLTGPGSSIAVMGTGPDLIYPATNRDLWREMADKGLILSEFPPGTKPHAGNFPLRNRIISGLCLGVLVVEASSRSGSLITARLAMEQGREVFAVPGPVSFKSYRGCHEIINKGAKLVHGAEDILVEIAPQLEAFLAGSGRQESTPEIRPYPVQARLVPDRPPPAAPPRRGGRARLAEPASPGGYLPDSPGASAAVSGHGPNLIRKSNGRNTSAAAGVPPQAPHNPASRAEPLLPFEGEVAGHLAAMGATHIDSLCRVFGRDASEMSRTLVVLELKGVVRRLPGGYYLSA